MKLFQLKLKTTKCYCNHLTENTKWNFFANPMHHYIGFLLFPRKYQNSSSILNFGLCVPLAWTSLPNSYLSVSQTCFLFLLRLVLYAILLGKAYCHHDNYLSFTIYHILLCISFIKLSGSVGSVFLYIFCLTQWNTISRRIESFSIWFSILYPTFSMVSSLTQA